MQVKDTQLPQPGLPLQQHPNDVLPQEAAATCDQVHQCRHLCGPCHAQLWGEKLALEWPDTTCSNSVLFLEGI